MASKRLILNGTILLLVAAIPGCGYFFPNKGVVAVALRTSQSAQELHTQVIPDNTRLVVVTIKDRTVSTATDLAAGAGLSPSTVPSELPTGLPSGIPSVLPTAIPTAIPTAVPTALTEPTSLPTATPTALPSPPLTVLATTAPLPDLVLQGTLEASFTLQEGEPLPASRIVRFEGVLVGDKVVEAVAYADPERRQAVARGSQSFSVFGGQIVKVTVEMALVSPAPSATPAPTASARSGASGSTDGGGGTGSGGQRTAGG